MFQLTACEIVTIERLFLYINTHILYIISLFFSILLVCVYSMEKLSQISFSTMGSRAPQYLERILIRLEIFWRNANAENSMILSTGTECSFYRVSDYYWNRFQVLDIRLSNEWKIVRQSNQHFQTQRLSIIFLIYTWKFTVWHTHIVKIITTIINYYL